MEHKQKFPEDVFPEEIQKYANDFCKSCRAPVQYFYAGVLASATSIASKTCIEMKPGYYERLNMYCVVVGKKGLAKSPPVKAALEWLEEYNMQLWKQYQFEKKKYDTALAASSGTDKKALKADPPLPPPEFMNNKGTMEGLMADFANNQEQEYAPHIVRFADEINGLFGDLNAYRGGAGSDLEQYLSLYNGMNFSVSNKTEKLKVFGATLTLVGTIQPDVMRRVGNMQDSGNGLVDRFSYFIDLSEAVPADAKYCINMGYKRMYDAYMQGLIEQPLPKRISVNHGLFNEIQKVYDELSIIGKKTDGAFKKWEQQFCKLLGILSVLWGEYEITLESIKRAERLIKYLAHSWIAGMGITEMSEHEDMEQAILKMLKEDGIVADKDLKRKKKFAGKKDIINDVISDLIASGSVAMDKNGKNVFYRMAT